MHTRSLATVLSLPQSFALEPAAVSLPQAAQHQRTQTGGWDLTQAARPNFLEPQQPPASSALATLAARQQQQQQPPYSMPASGTYPFVFVAPSEVDEKGERFSYQSLQCLPDFWRKSPEELRLEDYAANGIAELETHNAAQPTNSMFASQPAGGLFGTSTVGLFPAAPAFAAPQQQQQSVFSAFSAPQSAFLLKQQPSSFSAFAQPTWGTATAGFGTGWGATSNPIATFGSLQPSTVFGTLTSNAFQPQQQASLFAPQTSVFGQPQASFQTPQQAQFCWSISPTVCFSMFLATLPSSISTVSFGGVSVLLPTLAECAAAREKEKRLLAEVDHDPFGLHLLQPIEPLAERAATPAATDAAAAADEPAASGSLQASPLKRGTTSPLISPTRSPLLLPANAHARNGDALNPNLLSQCRSVAVSASLSHSPRLGPLPASPYLAPLAGIGGSGGVTSSPLQHSRTTSVHASPSKTRTLSDRASCRHAPAAASILFGSLSDHHGSPTKIFGTPEHHAHSAKLESMQQRDLEWAHRLVE